MLQRKCDLLVSPERVSQGVDALAENSCIPCKLPLGLEFFRQAADASEH